MWIGLYCRIVVWRNCFVCLYMCIVIGFVIGIMGSLDVWRLLTLSLLCIRLGVMFRVFRSMKLLIRFPGTTQSINKNYNNPHKCRPNIFYLSHHPINHKIPNNKYTFKAVFKVAIYPSHPWRKEHSNQLIT